MSDIKELDAHKEQDLSDKLMERLRGNGKGGDFVIASIAKIESLLEQLLTTQQALDSSCQTNQVLVKRLRIAAETLRRIVSYEEGDPTGGGIGGELIQALAKLGLNAIEGK